jgi:hypothetical protein
LLLLNFHNLDAVFFKHNSITVIDFKNFGGTLERADIDGDWIVNGTIVKGGASVNPFQQISLARQNLKRYLKNYIPESVAKLEHISTLVVFQNSIKKNNEIDEAFLTTTWFKITDFEHSLQILNKTRSSQINLTKEMLETLPRKFNIHNKELILDTKKQPMQ